MDLTTKTERALGRLTSREEQVLRMRFGIGLPADQTLEDTAREIGTSPVEVAQIEAQALRKLKSMEGRV